MKEKTPLSVEEKQAILLDIIKDVDSFCRSNNIKYSISDGTMLGAIRHGGFIPWDDDADICMLREDFDRFIDTYKSERYQLLYGTKEEDNVFSRGYVKINDPSTYGESTTITRDRFGVSLDIFPFENVPEDEKEQNKYLHAIRSTANRIYHKQKSDLFSKIKSCRHSLDGWFNKLDKLTHKYQHVRTHSVAQSIGLQGKSLVLPRRLFDNIVDVEFNNCTLRGFGDAHEYLTILFGDDYMTPKKWVHNEIVFRKDTPQESDK